MRKVLSAIAFFSMTPVANAAPLCPARLTLTQTASAADGFQLFNDGSPATSSHVAQTDVKFAGTLFSDGAPDQSAWLAPDSSTGQKMIWNFHDDDVQHPWISCTYTGTSLLLSKALPMRVTRCEAPLTNAQHVGQAVCQ